MPPRRRRLPLLLRPPAALLPCHSATITTLIFSSPARPLRPSLPQVLSTLNRFAADHGVPSNTWLSTDALNVVEPKGGNHKYRVVCKDRVTGVERVLLADFLCVTCGILAEQWGAEERGIQGLRRFKGVVTHAGKHRGEDCAAGNADLTGKNVVIVGSGSFAAEALEAAERSGAQHITVVGRPRHRWILPFSRQYTITAIANIPLLPWSWKSKVALVSSTAA